ncbi:MAG: FKBP-type peptidyl-prolyl cis-trans isomerase [Bacteroidales bacterium]|nr:FKBP-type peptidyl-prolyl cis-trans isomerase [Bacteroidales bacterium]
MKDKKQYALENKLWIDEIGKSEDVLKLANGVLYKVIQSGDGSKHPTPQSVITAHYTGKTIDGKVFDSSKGGAPLANRLSELIDGWIIALQNMTIGDKWEIYIPAEMGYGKYSQPGIPAYSTLIFEIELLGIF